VPTVLSVAYPFAPVTADPVGGAEQVLGYLDRALVAAGWRSVVIAAEGSAVAGELRTVPAVAGEIDDAARGRVHGAVRAEIARALADTPVDLIHLHGIDFDAYLPPPGPPALVSVHLPIDWYAPGALTPTRPGTYLLPVSTHQAGAAPPELALLPPIPQGVPHDYPRLTRRGYALCMGRLCPEKGYRHALDAAAAAGVPLLIAGAVFPYASHQAYVEAEIRPRLGPGRRWIGPVAGARKRRLLAAARCVLIPSTVPETSSLIAREAAAAGAPAIAFRSGALPEAVEHGRTGFIVDDAAGMAEAIGRVDEIDPEVCRARARERFSLPRMTDEHLALYARLIADEALLAGPA
jgi:glycosyltransferase involved in cell wall biosynthesis